MDRTPINRCGGFMVPRKTFRCTRNSLYMHDCAGRDNLAARQGYPVEAVDRAAALAEMRRDFPGDVFGFTATEWDEERGAPADAAGK